MDNTGLGAFALVPPSLRRNAILAIDVSFTSRGDVLRLNHEVLMRNVP